MTGHEFAAAVKAAGYTQKRFAELLGVHRHTVGERYAADVVEPYWVYALAGLIAGNAASVVAELVGKIDEEGQ
jgi:transcriptional regulator with XRE-family HTH domain